MSDLPAKRTPLYDLHIELGGKMVEFAGWELPIRYPAGLMAEHKHCREKAALFDVSHMGQIVLNGARAAKRLETLVPADIIGLDAGKARYTFFTSERGGILDDLIVSNAGDHLFLVVNASMRDSDVAHMKKQLPRLAMTVLEDRALIALQGPAAEAVLAPLCPEAAKLRFMETLAADVMNVPCRVSRLGYTGEDGYEISMPGEAAMQITRELLKHDDCMPAGLGARDSLRLEAGLCLYGNDINLTTSPVEASLVWAIQKRRREEGGYPGASTIHREMEYGVARKLVGIRPEGRAPARAGTEIRSGEGRLIGTVTSGGFGPTVDGPIAMGYVLSEHSEPGSQIALKIRGKLHPAAVATLPFVTQRYRR